MICHGEAADTLDAILRHTGIEAKNGNLDQQSQALATRLLWDTDEHHLLQRALSEGIIGSPDIQSMMHVLGEAGIPLPRAMEMVTNHSWNTWYEIQNLTVFSPDGAEFELQHDTAQNFETLIAQQPQGALYTSFHNERMTNELRGAAYCGGDEEGVCILWAQDEDALHTQMGDLKRTVMRLSRVTRGRRITLSGKPVIVIPESH